MLTMSGVDGVDVVIGTSQQLRDHSHKKSMKEIMESAIEVIQYIKRQAHRATGENMS